MAKAQKTIENKTGNQKRSYTSQSDIPTCSLEDSLRISRSIVENYASRPVTPIQLAQAIQLTPTSSSFRMLCGASIAYGLTEGGYSAVEIKLTDLALRILKPRDEGDDLKAKRESFTKPRVIFEFMSKYDGNLIPRQDIACNVLESFGVTVDKTEEVFNTIVFEGAKLGLIKEIKGKNFIDLKGASSFKDDEIKNDENKKSEYEPLNENNNTIEKIEKPLIEVSSQAIVDSQRKKRVYISHGKDMSFVEPIKKLLKFGEMEAIVSVEKQSVSKPVPDKVMNDM